MNARISLLAALSFVPLACSPTSNPETGPGTELLTTTGVPSGLTYAQGRPVYRAARAIPPNVATVQQGLNLTFSIQPALPPGLVMSPTTGEITGTPAQPRDTTRHTVTATNSLGSTSAQLSMTILPFSSELETSSYGEAPFVRLVAAYYGRLVDVYDRNPATQSSHLIARDVLVRGSVATGGAYLLETDVATQKTRVTVLAELGSSSFTSAYDDLTANLNLLFAAGPGGLPPYPYVPRNATIALVFDDLLDPATITADNVRVLTGVPTSSRQAVRLLADPNHGNVTDDDQDGRLEFWSTRVLIDPVVSSLEALANPQPIPVDADGFPPSDSQGAPNVIVRVPTLVVPGSGQLDILRNLSGFGVSASQSGPNDPQSPTLDVVRVLRAGGPSDATGDPYNGVLPDFDAPHVVAEIPATVTSVGSDPQGNRADRVIDVTYATTACAAPLRGGDSVATSGTFYSVLATSGAPVGGTVTGVRVKILVRGTSPIGGATVYARLDPAQDSARLACFLQFTPAPGTLPATAVDPAAVVRLRSDEALDVASLSAMDDTRIARVASGAGGEDIAAALAQIPGDLHGVTIRPLVPLAHVAGLSETWYATAAGWRDLAGNPLAAALGPVAFTLDPQAATVTSGSFTFDFSSNDMLPGNGDTQDPGFGRPEFRGQYLLDLGQGLLRARPVTRFQSVADRTQPVPSIMIPFTPGTQTPISRFGSKLHAQWRYCDVGFALLDEQFSNVDVERLYWAPAGGATISDVIPRFEIGLSHGGRLPDESLDPNLLPSYPNSGLVTTYAQNVLDAANDPLQTVHPGASGTPGYIVNPVDEIVTSTGTVVMPWPLNRGIPTAQYTYYTWRDTALQAVGAPGGPGAELEIVRLVTGTGTAGQPYAPGNVPSIGMPLLMEFRCYPDDVTLGLNAFDVSLAAASSPRPNFRAFSTGGFNTSGQAVVIDPDNQPVATGGYNPGSIPTPGASTMPVENTFYIGAMDLVVRVSRVHSIWLDSGDASPAWSATIEPSAAALPAGTQVQLAYRGATAVANQGALTDAGQLDPYGEPYSGADPTFFQNDPTWKDALAQVDGARFLQVRISLISNAATNQAPYVSTLGIAWQ